MKRTQLKDSVRTIKKTIVSWISVVIVTLIGCGVYFGVYFYADSLADNGKKFFDESNYEDFGIVATDGFTDKEIEEIRGFDGIKDAEGGFFFPNVYILFLNQSANDFRIQSIKACSNTERISQTKLVDGRLPKEKNECALTQSQMDLGKVSIGDKVYLLEPASELSAHLIEQEFTITGVVEQGDAISQNSSDYVYLSEEAFNKESSFDCYTYVHVKADLPEGLDYLGKDYEEALLPIKDKVREQLKPIAEKHDDYMKAVVGEGLNLAFDSMFDEMASAVESIAENAESAEDKTENIGERAEETLTKIANTGYGIILRGEKESFQLFQEDVNIIHRLALIFIAIFLIIGVIVILSTITIQIDNNRKYLGTMVAYGFRSGEIIKKYLIYGVSAVALGMLVSIGLAAGLQVLISSVIGKMFSIKADSFSFFWISYAVLCAIEIGMAIATSIIATNVNVNSVSVIDLINGVAKQKKNKKSVKSDKKAGTLYSRLIMRNMKKDRGRVITSIVIIAGSCLMIGLGITLRGSLMNLMPASREEVNNYDVELSLAMHYDAERVKDLTELLEEKGVEYKTVRKDNTMYISGDSEEYLTVVRGSEGVFPDYIRLEEWEGDGEYIPDENQVIIDNRLSERLGLGIGDKFFILDQGYSPHEVTITGVCKNYSGRLVYLSPDVYKKVFNNVSSKDNDFLVRLNGASEDDLAQAIELEFPDVMMTFTDRLPAKMDTVTRMFNVIVYLLIGLSIIMAVFVLLNLVNIFVKRRQNELIIMSVNGFRFREQLGYLLKESLATTLLGLGLGVLIGWLMTDMVVRTVESSAIMHDRSFNVIAWLIAVGLEALFAMLIYLFAFRRIRSLNLTDITK